MNDWESVKELHALCGRMDLIRVYEERKLSVWSSVIVVQAYYDSLSRTKQFTLLAYHYDVVIGQSAPNDMKNNITDSFINTVLLM